MISVESLALKNKPTLHSLRAEFESPQFSPIDSRLAPYFYEYACLLISLAQETAYDKLTNPNHNKHNIKKTYNPFSRIQEEGQFDAALMCLQGCLDIYEMQLQDLEQDQFKERKAILGYVIRTNKKLGDLFVFIGKYDYAFDHYRVAKEYIEQINPKNNKQIAQVLIEMAGTKNSNVSQQNHLYHAISLYTQASRHLILQLQIHKPNVSFPFPQEDIPQIQTHLFMPSYSDTEYVKQLKDVIGQVLQHIADARIQIDEIEQYGQCIQETLDELMNSIQQLNISDGDEQEKEEKRDNGQQQKNEKDNKEGFNKQNEEREREQQKEKQKELKQGMIKHLGVYGKKRQSEIECLEKQKEKQNISKRQNFFHNSKRVSNRFIDSESNIVYDD